MTNEPSGQPRGGQWDHVARQLQQWRLDADEPSYSELALAISRQRELSGLAAAAARVGRTTVYDAFRLGRTRINRSLVREICQALGVDDRQVQALLDDPGPAPAPPPAVPRAEKQPAAPAALTVPPQPVRYGVRQSLLIMAGCLGINFLGREFVDVLALPIYLDMVGTALAAIVLGPWRGAAVGASANLLLYFVTGPDSVPFAIVNVVGALVWGYGVHKFGMGRTLARFFALSLAVALACSLVAVPILYFLFDGSLGHEQDSLTENMLVHTSSFALALLVANILTSVADKTISAFLALVGASLLGHGLTGEVAGPSSRHARQDATELFPPVTPRSSFVRGRSRSKSFG